MFCLAFALFLCKLGFLGKDLHTHDLAYARKLNSCVHRPVLACVMPLPRNANFCLFCFCTHMCILCSLLFMCFKPHNYFLPFNMFVYCHMCRLGFRLGFLNVNMIHSHGHALMS